MKKILTICFITLLTPTLFSQTIQRTNLPSPGESYNGFLVDNVTTWNPGSAGQGQTWDFSTYTGGEITLNYGTVDPSSNYAQAGAEMKVTLPGLGDSYLGGNSNEYQLIGNDVTYNGIRYNYVYSNPQIQFKFPMNYGDSFKDTAIATFPVSISGFPATNKRKCYSETTVDGTGTLILPGKTYENVVRVKITQSVIDSTYNNLVATETPSSVEEYYFFSQDYKHYLLHFIQITPPTGQTLSGIFYFSNPIVLSTGIGKSGLNNVLAYPNPADSEFFVELPGDLVSGELRLINTEGKAVRLEKVASGTNRISVSGMKPGLYIYEVVSNGQIKSTGRISVK